MHTKSVSVLFLLSCIQAFAVRELVGSTAKSLLQTSSPSMSETADASDTSETDSDTGTSGGAISLGPDDVIAEAQAAGFDITQARDQFAAALANAISEDVPQINRTDDTFVIVNSVGNPFSNAVVDVFIEAVRTRRSSTGESVSECQTSDFPALAAAATAQTFINVLSQASDRISFVNPSGAISALITQTIRSFDSALPGICRRTFFTERNFFFLGINTAYRPVTALALALSHPFTFPEPIVVRSAGNSIVATTATGRDLRRVLIPVVNRPQALIAIRRP